MRGGWVSRRGRGSGRLAGEGRDCTTRTLRSFLVLYNDYSLPYCIYVYAYPRLLSSVNICTVCRDPSSSSEIRWAL